MNNRGENIFAGKKKKKRPLRGNSQGDKNFLEGNSTHAWIVQIMVITGMLEGFIK